MNVALFSAPGYWISRLVFLRAMALIYLIAFLVAAIMGLIIERIVIRPLYGRPLETLLATWGVSLILQQSVRMIFGPTNKEVGNPSWASGAFELGQMSITYNRLWLVLFSLGRFDDAWPGNHKRIADHGMHAAGARRLDPLPLPQTFRQQLP